MSESPACLGFTLADFRRAYTDGATPRGLLVPLRASLTADDPAWISLVDPQRLEEALSALEARRASGEPLPLFGVPFAVKDNIDVAGLPTTAACPSFAYTPSEDAAVVAALREAGAIVLGKTNLDQFATGLVGTRSPYGAVPNTFDPRYISGGSSSGSGSVVARGIVPFALGTDTAGSGRVPAAFNGIVGMKPSLGRLSTRGLVPACRTLDCISVFALETADAALVTALAARYDPRDPYARDRPQRAPSLGRPVKLGVPRELSFFGDAQAEAAFTRTCKRVAGLGWELVPVDYTPFRTLAELLYQGPWVAERYAVMERTLLEQPSSVDPVVKKVVEGAPRFSAVEAFRAEYRRAELARAIAGELAGVDALLVPTTPTLYTHAQIAEEPVLYNSRLGTYTNFVNLADLCAYALPGLPREDGMPAGITLIAKAGDDDCLLALGAHIELELGATRGVTARVRAGASVTLAVVGAHLRGLPLHHQLEAVSARYLETASTSAAYRLYALPRTEPKKPGLVRTGNGAPIEVELYSVPVERLGAFVALVPAPLSIGTLSLADGREVKGFLCEASAVEGAEDITRFGGFKAYLKGV
jgi:allophanate hydrolase